MKIDIKQRLHDLALKAKDYGINLNLKGESPLEFDGGKASTPEQKKVAQQFEQVLAEQVEQTGMSRRDFLKTPLGVTAAAIAVSAGLGISIFPTRAEGRVIPDGVYDFICYGYPTVPNRDLGDPFDPPDANTFIDPNEGGEQKVALVIGGSTGMGRNAADKLHALGWKVVGTSRTPRSIDLQPEWDLWRLELTSPLSIAYFVYKVKRLLGRVDLLICNAGRLVVGRPLTSSRSKMRQGMETLVEGHITLVQKIVPLMPTEGYARILFTSSFANHAYSTLRVPMAFDESGNPTDFLNLSGISETYNRGKAALTRFAAGITAEQENGATPLLQQILGYPQGQNANITVSTIHPLGVATNLVKDTLYTESGPLIDNLKFLFENSPAAGISVDVAGDAFVQMAMLREGVYGHTLIADLELDPCTDPNTFFSQLSLMMQLAEEQDKTVRSLGTEPDLSQLPPCPEPEE